MAMRAAMMRAVAAPARGVRALLFSTERTSPLFSPPPPPTANNEAPKAEPSNNLFVSGLNKRTTTEGLQAAFEKFGRVLEAKVVTDRVSGYSKGFGFVKYETLEEAEAGKQGMDAQFLDGWVIFVEYAKPKSPAPRQNFQSNSYPGFPRSNGFNNTRF